MVNNRRVNISLTATDRAAELARCVLCLPQNRHLPHSQQQRMRSQRQDQEQYRQQEARRVDRERQQQAGLKDEESCERRRYQRQVQQELRDMQMESALMKVGFMLYRSW